MTTHVIYHIQKLSQIENLMLCHLRQHCYSIHNVTSNNFLFILCIYYSITVVHPRAAVKGHSSRETISTSSGTCALSETSKITSHKCKGGKRFAASSLDKENLIASPVSHPAPNLTVKSLDPNAAGSISRMSKRASIQEDISNKPKKSVKSCRRRLLPQVKGQAKITGFFRM